jgi:hypothetical protein
MPTASDPKRLSHLAPVGDGVPVCVDSAEENMVVALALNAHHTLDGTWNGWARPVATAADFADILAQWRLNDVHGTWGEAHETLEGLVYQDMEGNDPDVFPEVATSAEGNALYDLSGWVWVRI